MEKPEHISDEEKKNIFNRLVQPGIDFANKHLTKKEGPEEALKKGVGFTSKPTSGTIGTEGNPVEFKPGESNQDAIEKNKGL